MRGHSSYVPSVEDTQPHLASADLVTKSPSLLPAKIPLSYYSPVRFDLAEKDLICQLGWQIIEQEA